MAMNMAMKAALKAISMLDLDVKKTYKVERHLENLSSVQLIKPDYEIWDKDINCGSHKVPIRIFSRSKKSSKRVLLFFHGGGWVLGNIDSYSKMCGNMAKMTGHTVISVDYRRAPESPFPAAVEDCYAAAKSLFLGEMKEIGSENITLIGDSAGGNLAAALSLMARDRGEFAPTRQILIYPALYNDYSENSPFSSVSENGNGYILSCKRISDLMDMYKSKIEDLSNPYFAPLMADDLSNQPETLIISAQYCPLRDEAEYYGKKLEDSGGKVIIHRVPDVLHGFMSLSLRFSRVRETYDIINSFLQS